MSPDLDVNLNNKCNILIRLQKLFWAVSELPGNHCLYFPSTTDYISINAKSFWEIHYQIFIVEFPFLAKNILIIGRLNTPVIFP